MPQVLGSAAVQARGGGRVSRSGQDRNASPQSRSPPGQNAFLDPRLPSLDHDYERLPERSDAMVHCSMIGLMLRRLAHHQAASPGRPTP
jgi:hypothetical protein